jgi:hypothetical protein
MINRLKQNIQFTVLILLRTIKNERGMRMILFIILYFVLNNVKESEFCFLNEDGRIFFFSKNKLVYCPF